LVRTVKEQEASGKSLQALYNAGASGASELDTKMASIDQQYMARLAKLKEEESQLASYPQSLAQTALNAVQQTLIDETMH
jgi:hypothetical protein